MRRSSTVVGALVLFMTPLAIMAGCGVGKSSSPPQTNRSLPPTMPMPISGRASLAGQVRDSDGNGVAGATIKVSETEATVTTDAEGGYQMSVPSDSTLTLMTTASGFAPSYRESIVLADQAVVVDFDVLVLSLDTVNRLDGMSAVTRGLMAVRLHSVSPSCVLAGAEVSIWPPQAATVMYSRPNPAGGLEEPDVDMTSVQPGMGIGVWLVGAFPPGNTLQIDVKKAGCRQLATSPSMGGMLFPGLRRVGVQSLTVADLFFE